MLLCRRFWASWTVKCVCKKKTTVNIWMSCHRLKNLRTRQTCQRLNFVVNIRPRCITSVQRWSVSIKSRYGEKSIQSLCFAWKCFLSLSSRWSFVGHGAAFLRSAASQRWHFFSLSRYRSSTNTIKQAGHPWVRKCVHHPCQERADVVVSAWNIFFLSHMRERKKERERVSEREREWVREREGERKRKRKRKRKDVMFSWTLFVHFFAFSL